ncbi:hypothetical protein GH714_027838 [Hevea brasiliensis]|uniref:Origin recognition complex subunit 1 n=1 Tax=Hevea brasiliensis TaxID=3981 RepID=A0A6A6MJ54_HEVBR|nr:hypothetical protein GH714_027838 [Hevea brasiliensis]
MADTPRKPLRSPSKKPKQTSSSSISLTPQTPQAVDPPRRSSRRLSLKLDQITTPQKPISQLEKPNKDSLVEELETPHKLVKDSSRTRRNSRKNESTKNPESKTDYESANTPKSRTKVVEVEVSFSPASPDQLETKKRKRREDKDRKVITRAMASKMQRVNRRAIRRGFIIRKWCMMVVNLKWFSFEVLEAASEGSPRRGLDLRVLQARKLGMEVELPTPAKGKRRARTLREKLLSSDLWAAHIESTWKEMDGSYWFKGRWYMIPEETTAGRQPHNLRRELYRTNDFADIEMESIIRHCFVLNPKEYAKATEIDNEEEDGEDADSDEDWISSKDAESGTDEDIEYENENVKNLCARTSSAHGLAANSRKGQFFGLQKIGTKRIPEHVRCHKKTELEKAKATLLLAILPKSLPCRNKEMEEITAFIKGAICDDQCLGRCLYVHGVPGTGKTMSVLAVMRNLRYEVDAGSIQPYCFVEVNGLKLASPENIYRVIYEALSGNRVSWKKALHLLNERFSNGKKVARGDDRPCILLIDELDLLVTRNQSVLYNILDWPTKPHSKLIVIGIANTMDLPEKLLPRISSRMGIQRLCFGPYNYQQLQEIISSRLKGIDAFEKQAIEFASRKVAAISGDARRALEICRRAAEIADYCLKKSSSNLDATPAGKGLVGMSEVEAAIQEMFQAPHIQVMKNCSKLSKIFLTAMVYELYKTGMSDTTFEKLAITVSCLCTSNGEAFPGWDTLLKVGCMLGESRIILCEPGARHRLQKLQLNFPSDDVAFALKGNKDLPWLAKYL